MRGLRGFVLLALLLTAASYLCSGQSMRSYALRPPAKNYPPGLPDSVNPLLLPLQIPMEELVQKYGISDSSMVTGGTLCGSHVRIVPYTNCDGIINVTKEA